MEEKEQSSVIAPFNWDGRDAFGIMVLIFLGVFSRFWIIQYPRHMVVYEDKHIHMINCYLNGSFYIDTNPPLASILMAGVAKAADYNFAYMLPRTEVNYSYTDMQYIAMRSTPSFFAAIAIPLSYFIIRSFGASRLASFGGAFFFLCDFLMISLSRHIMTDGFLQFFIAATVLFAAVGTHFRAGSGVWYFLIVCESIFAGCAISTNLASIGVILFVIFMNRKSLGAVVMNIIVPVSIFIFSFTLQVYLMPYHSKYDSVLSESYRWSLSEPGRNKPVDHSTLLNRAFELISVMFAQRKAVAAYPPEWWNWPFMTTSWVVLWTQLGRVVACFGNVVVWIPAAAVMLILVGQIFITRKMNQTTHMLLIGYAASLLFFVFGLNERGLCDYEIALMFAIWALPVFVDEVSSETISGFVHCALIVGAGFLFILWAPLVYGYENFDMKFLPYFVKEE